VAIVFNGMIYNYRELMALLQGRGHVFRTKCDTETIVHAWEEWGPDCVQHLNGFFAFAIWDRRRGKLFLARDRLGKKPLHYAKLADGSLAFSSELSSFAQVPGLARKVSATAVDDFFTYGYIPDPGTIYEGILKLPAAHSLLVERGSRRVVPQRYWSVPTATAKMDAREAAQALVDQLRHSVGQRMIADVPLGAFLSGGVDSSAVVALAAPQRGGTLDTFTIGFDGAEDGDGMQIGVVLAVSSVNNCVRPEGVHCPGQRPSFAEVYGVLCGVVRMAIVTRAYFPAEGVGSADEI
jgi:asparagine synthase (glutamine-hydrolysing)